jgi:hypothetical protein
LTIPNPPLYDRSYEALTFVVESLPVVERMRAKTIILLIAVISITVGAFYETTVRSVTLYPTKDSYSWQSVPNANNGKSDNFEIASSNKPPYNMRGWIEFNVSRVPSDSWIVSATLRLRLWHKTTDDPPQGDSTGRIYGVYRATQPWSETGVTWANQPNYTTVHGATSPVPTEQGGWFGPVVWMDWDLTSIMKDWQQGNPNYGLVVRDTQENASTFYSTQFFTHDQVPSEDYFPRLVTTYINPTPLYAFVTLIAIELVLFAVWLKKGGNSFQDYHEEQHPIRDRLLKVHLKAQEESLNAAPESERYGV